MVDKGSYNKAMDQIKRGNNINAEDLLKEAGYVFYANTNMTTSEVAKLTGLNKFKYKPVKIGNDIFVPSNFRYYNPNIKTNYNTINVVDNNIWGQSVELAP